MESKLLTGRGTQPCAPRAGGLEVVRRADGRMRDSGLPCLLSHTAPSAPSTYYSHALSLPEVEQVRPSMQGRPS